MFYACRYGIRGSANIGALQLALREELYTAPYESINWDGARNTCASIDLYAPHTALMDVAVSHLPLLSVFVTYAEAIPNLL